jgi:hypothetical protein
MDIKLTPEQTNLIRFVYDKQQAIFSALLSTIATEHNAPVTDKTQFALNQDLTSMEVKELKEEPIKESKD